MAPPTAGSSVDLPKDRASRTPYMPSTAAATSNSCIHLNLPSRPTLLTLPPEILGYILYFCSAPHDLSRGGELNHSQLQCSFRGESYYAQLRRSLPLPRTTAKAIYSTCKALRIFLLDLGCRGESLRIPCIEGITHWVLTPPIWQYSKDISLCWDDTGLIAWAWGVEDVQWATMKTRSDSLYGVREPEMEVRTPEPLRADQINMTGEKPKDFKAYTEACRAYLKKPPPPAPLAKRHRLGLAQDLYAMIRGCKGLQILKLDFPGATDAFTQAVMELPEDADIFDTVKVLQLRNGNEILFPPPQKLFSAISRLRSLQEVHVVGNCGGRGSLFSVKERKRRGIYVGGGEEEVSDNEALSRLWGWACEPLELPEMPKGLKQCKVYSMPGLATQEGLVDGRSTGVWTWDYWPKDVRLGEAMDTERLVTMDEAQ